MIKKNKSPRHRAKASRIEELQPLSWDIMSIPEALRSAYALRLPPHWVNTIAGLANVDEIPPVTSLYTVLRVLAPEILYFFPSSFAAVPERRPLYWLLADGSGTQLSAERLLWAIKAWLNTCYGNEVVRAIDSQFQASDLRWERLDLEQAASDEVMMGAFPGLIARWLLNQPFQLSLSNEAGQRVSYPLRLAPSYGPEVDIVTWEPTGITWQEEEYCYSYYLTFRLSSLPSPKYFRLLCQPGIRRWVTRPLVKIDKSDKTHIDLAWGREKSVFVARHSASWLTQRSAETSLIRLGLRRYQSLIWVGRLPDVLANLTAEETIPDPFELLVEPKKFYPSSLIVYDTSLSGRHLVGAGIEEIDRWEIQTQLTQILPEGLTPTSLFKKSRIFQRLEPSSSANLSSKRVSSSARLQGIKHMRTPACIEICSTDSERVEAAVLEELGLTRDALIDECIPIATDTGAASVLKIVKRVFRSELIAELPPAAGEDEESRFGATRGRTRLIEKELEAITGNAGVLLELPNYQTYYKESKQKRRDPKLGVMWGFARRNRKLQTFQPKQLDDETYEERIHNAVRDLLRQMDFRLNPLYMGFKGTSLPQDLDLLAFWQIRLKARKRGESAVTLPVLIHAPAHEYGLYVCLPGEYGPLWYPYSDALVMIPDFPGGCDTSNKTRAFAERAIQDRNLSHATLLLISEQNARAVFPELKDEYIQIHSSSWHCTLPLGNVPCRVARLRYSGYGTVPLVCPTHSFGRFSGLFHDSQVPHVFYSFQERPILAKRPQALHQRDAQDRLSWNPSTVEIVLLNMQADDQEDEWAWLVHRLRQESSHTGIATLLPEPLYAASKIEEYVLRIGDEPNGTGI